MAKPPESPPTSDIEGAHKDGTGPSRPLPAHGADAGDLERAERESKARPNRESDESRDDRSE